MAFLTMAFPRQPVATHSNGFRLSEPLSASSLLRPVATGCDRWASIKGPRLVAYVGYDARQLDNQRRLERSLRRRWRPKERALE